MDWLQQVYEHVYFPLFEGSLKRRRTAQLYRSALRSQWKSRGELESQQLGALNELLAHSKTHSPYWSGRRELPGRVDSLAELSQLPILTKSDIRANFEVMTTPNLGARLWRKSTGGSTGEPLHFAYTKESYEWRVAMSLRGYGWAGAPPGSKQAYIWGVATTPPSTLSQLKEKLHQTIERKLYFNCFEFDQDDMRRCLKSMERWRPHAVVGYTNPLYELARFAEINSHHLQIPNVLCAAEKVHSVQRETIANAFGCSVFDTYGSREFMLIASECEEHSGMHVSMENLIVEVVDELGKPVPAGSVGRILVTDLHNYGMPFIRYEIGDLARATDHQCPCGRGLTMINDVVGRALDVIKTPLGRIIPGEFFPHLMKEYPAIRRFQVIQEKLDTLNVLLMGHGDIAPDAITDIEEKVTQALGEPMNLTLSVVSDIPLNRTGKHRVTISRLDESKP